MSFSKGVTAVLNFQSATEAENWGIDSKLVNESCQKFDMLMINYPIRPGDSYDLRKKLPFCVGLLLRLLKKNHRVFVTCTTGFERSPASVIAYLHWMADTSLHVAYNYITSLHSCKLDRESLLFLNFQSATEAENWGIDSKLVNKSIFLSILIGPNAERFLESDHIFIEVHLNEEEDSFDIAKTLKTPPLNQAFSLNTSFMPPLPKHRPLPQNKEEFPPFNNGDDER